MYFFVTELAFDVSGMRQNILFQASLAYRLHLFVLTLDLKNPRLKSSYQVVTLTTSENVILETLSENQFKRKVNEFLLSGY